MQLLPLLAWALLPGCGAVTGPGTVRGLLGASLAVTCRYEPGLEKLPKFWCIPGVVATCAEDLVITSEWKPEVQKGRFSIRDNRREREFTVTVDPLSEEDDGTFRCGVRTGKYQRDDTAVVEVMVESASSTLPSLTYRTTTFSDPIPSVPTVSPGEIVQSTSNPPSPQLCQLSVIHLLLLLSIKVPVALAVVCGAAWLRRRCRSREQEEPQLLELGNSSPRAWGCPPVPSTSEPQGRPPAPPGPSLLGPGPRPGLPCAGPGSAPPAPAPGKPRPLLAAPGPDRQGFGVPGACVCSAAPAK